MLLLNNFICFCLQFFSLHKWFLKNYDFQSWPISWGLYPVFVLLLTRHPFLGVLLNLNLVPLHPQVRKGTLIFLFLFFPSVSTSFSSCLLLLFSIVANDVTMLLVTHSRGVRVCMPSCSSFTSLPSAECSVLPVLSLPTSSCHFLLNCCHITDLPANTSFLLLFHFAHL